MDASVNNSSSNSSQSVRGKTDIAWNHVTETKGSDGKKVLSCLYCGISIKGGGINRMKQHLAGKKGEIRPCKSCPPDVTYQMEESLKEIVGKKKENQENFESRNPYGPSLSHFEGDDVEVQEIPHQNISEGNQKGKEKALSKIGDYFAPRTTSGSQPTIKSVLANKEAVLRANMEVAKFFYDTCIPINASNSIYFQRMFDAAMAIGPGYKVPTYHDLRVPLLRNAKKEVQLFVDSLRSKWAECGCTIMGDGWTDNRQRTLINFMVYSPRGTIFWKSVDPSGVVKDAKTLFKLFSEVIEWVGPENIVHLVTDNGANYVAVGKIVSDTYKTINWSPYAAHCLNLVMQDISKLEHVDDLAKKASAITKFVYNHGYWLSWLRKRKGWTEIIRPGATRFATTFIALQNVYQHMHDLKALVTCKEFCDSRLFRDQKTKEVVSIVLDNKFWNDCLIVVKVVEPLMRVLRIVDGDKKPSIGYVFEGMYRARKAIKMVFNYKKKYYKVYTNIIKKRWDRQLKQSIHAAAYWLNPAFQYDQTNFCRKVYVMDSIIEMVHTKGTGSKTKLLDETRLFRDRIGSFGHELALVASKTTQPDEWWKLFGHSAPNLQQMAIRILGQTSSSSGCERNWSVFDRIHTKRRNRLEHQRLSDLVFVHYNLKLKNRFSIMEKNYDPIDFESIDKIDFWILEEEDEEPFINCEELENMLYEDLEAPRLQRKRHRQEDDEDATCEVQANTDDMDFSSYDKFAYLEDLDMYDFDVGIGGSGTGTGIGSNRVNNER